MVKEARGEIIAIWEDDDIFLPWNLSDVAACHAAGGNEFYISQNVWSTHAQDFGEVELVDAAGVYHSSWRFTK